MTNPTAAGNAEASTNDAVAQGGAYEVLRKRLADQGQRLRGIADALNADGANVTKAMIILERPIKTLGVFPVKIALHPEVSVSVTVNVARSDDEAELQKAGVDVMAQMFEEDQAPAGFVEKFDPNAEPGTIPVDEPEEGEGEDAAA